MKKLALVMSMIFFGTIVSPVFAQNKPLSQEEVESISQRLTLLRNEADALLEILNQQNQVSAYGVGLGLPDSAENIPVKAMSIADIIDSLNQAILDIDALLKQAKTFLEQGGKTMDQLGNRVDVSMEQIADRISANLDQTGQKVNALVEQTQELVRSGQQSVDQVGNSIELGMVNLSVELAKSLQSITQQVNDVVIEIKNLIKSINEEAGGLADTVDAQIEVTGQKIAIKLEQIGDNIAGLIAQTQRFMEELTEQTELTGAQIRNSVQQMGDRMNDGLQQVTNNVNDNMDVLTEQLKTEMHTMSVNIQVGLVNLNDDIELLLQTTSAFVKEATITLKEIRESTVKTVDFFNSLEGRLSVDVYAGTNRGFDSRASLMLWRNVESDRIGVPFLNAGVVDLDHRPLPDICIGGYRAPVSLSLGYIEQGLGLRVGYRELEDQGFDARASFSRLSDPMLDLEFGYTHKSGFRGFIYADDVTRPNREFGLGIGYRLGF